MIPRQRTIHLISPADLPPSRDGFEVIGTFNPAAVAFPSPEHPDRVALLVRVAERPLERRPGFHASPYYTADGDLALDFIPDDAVSTADPRMLVFHDTGFKRLTFTSHLRVCFTHTGEKLDVIGPCLEPPHRQNDRLHRADRDAGSSDFDPLTSFGYEDPRITQIGDDFIITVVGASPHGVVTQLLRTTDFERFDTLGTAFCRENKDVVLFPRRFAGQYAAIHRPTGRFEVQPAEMWLAFSPDLRYWGDHAPLYGMDYVSLDQNKTFDASSRWDNGRIGGGVPPIATDAGWLVIYHASCRPTPGEPIGVYAAGALLLDLEHPSRVLAALPEPFMTPDEDFERAGFVKAVVFPTGYALRGDALDLYYGAADTHVGVARYALSELLHALETSKR